MQKQEFTSLTGLDVTVEQYANIEALYAAAGDMDKQTFCKLIKKHLVRNCDPHHENDLAELDEVMTLIAERLRKNERTMREAAQKANATQKAQDEKDYAMAEFLLGKAAVYKDSDFEDEARRLIPHKDCIFIKLNYGYPLSDDDLSYLHSHLD